MTDTLAPVVSRPRPASRLDTQQRNDERYEVETESVPSGNTVIAGAGAVLIDTAPGAVVAGITRRLLWHASQRLRARPSDDAATVYNQHQSYFSFREFPAHYGKTHACILRRSSFAVCSCSLISIWRRRIAVCPHIADRHAAFTTTGVLLPVPPQSQPQLQHMCTLKSRFNHAPRRIGHALAWSSFPARSALELGVPRCSSPWLAPDDIASISASSQSRRFAMSSAHSAKARTRLTIFSPPPSWKIGDEDPFSLKTSRRVSFRAQSL